ncbi:transcription antiterminator [Mesobacillus subterraneus]|uniref:BglG family transcription antiterminator n=1 Tax=Mesobacillus subterraneus TaxID=285983 RepID=UPI0020411C3F|nr:transcription antiterminator [Mesobacillus subterraneus]MCM3663666.1 transcription antiterminator [Mesobacillus subterraneus]MCM3683431.1 transcription antiterminator [Mesobacillus subterraneus]
MTLNARRIWILNRLLQADSYIPLAEIIREWEITRSTVYRDIKEISDWLESNSLQPVCYIRKHGFCLETNEKIFIKEKVSRIALNPDYHRSARERLAWIGILLLTREEPIFLANLMEKLRVSRSTILRDVEKLKARLARHRLNLQLEKDEGYHIIGLEQDKRRSLVHFLARIHPNKESHWLNSELQSEIEKNWSNELFASPEAAAVHRILFESEKYLNIHYPDDMIEILSIHLLFLLKRYRQGKMMDIDPMEKVILKPAAEYQAAQFIGKQIEEEFKLIIPDDELCYISVCLMGAKTEEYCPSSAGEAELDLLKNIIEKMVSDFEEDFHLAFHDREVLERSLYFHLKSAYYRIIYGLEFENPLAETIISNYSDLFRETKKVIHHLELAICKKVPDEEVALITMHFGGWIERPSA